VQQVSLELIALGEMEADNFHRVKTLMQINILFDIKKVISLFSPRTIVQIFQQKF
jgi:hypothetical protein